MECLELQGLEQMETVWAHAVFRQEFKPPHQLNQRVLEANIWKYLKTSFIFENLFHLCIPSIDPCWGNRNFWCGQPQLLVRVIMALGQPQLLVRVIMALLLQT